MAKRLFIIYTLLILLIPNVALCFTEGMSTVASLCNILLPGAFILFILTISRRIGVNIWLLFPYFFFSAFQLVLLKLYGRSIIAVDMFLNLVTTNAGEVTELLSNLLPIVGLVFILYLPVLVAGGIMWHRHIEISPSGQKTFRRVATLCLIAGLFSLGIAVLGDDKHDPKDDIFPLNVCYNVYLAIERTAKTASYHETSGDFTYGAVPTHPSDSTEIYIAIIGETSRAGNWQLFGYGRPTTPLLSMRDDLFAGGNTMSESNTTHKSVPMLLSPVSAKDFDKEIYRTKSLVTAFKEAGFKTAFISNQRYNHSFIDFFAEEADTTVFIKELGLETDINLPEDLKLLPVMDSIMGQGGNKQLIVLHTYGSHFNYRDRYAGTTGTFLPDDYTEADRDNRDRLINSYDNTITVTDRLIAGCIERIETMKGALGGVIYTSDHGEDIFDDGKSNFLHASPLPTIHQVHVPFVIWLSPALKDLMPYDTDTLRKNMARKISSSASYTPTLLMMAGIRTAKADSTKSLLSPDYREEEPVYLNDHNECVPLKGLL